MSGPSLPRLFYMPRTRSGRVLWMLEEIGEPYDLTEVAGAERRSPDHLKRHPLGRVPALELPDGTYLMESAAICLALADRAPAAELIAAPATSARALHYQWVLFSVAELEAPLFRWLRDRGDGETQSAAGDRFADAATALQSTLADRDWLVADRFSVADLMCASLLEGASSRGLLEPWPTLEAYVQRAVARPAYQRAAEIFDRPRS